MKIRVVCKGNLYDSGINRYLHSHHDPDWASSRHSQWLYPNQHQTHPPEVDQLRKRIDVSMPRTATIKRLFLNRKTLFYIGIGDQKTRVWLETVSSVEAGLYLDTSFIDRFEPESNLGRGKVTP